MTSYMRLAFILYKYFPFGGLQRDFVRIAECCQEKGHQIFVYTMGWEGEKPKGFEVHILRPKALTASQRNEKFYVNVQQALQTSPVDLVIGFNKMPGLDIYYAADTCYEHKAQTLRGKFYQHSGRYKHFSSYEKAVFSVSEKTETLLLSDVQQALFSQYYGTPSDRMHLLPPGIAKDRKRSANAPQMREDFRKKYGVLADEHLLVLLGSGFITKGLDRALLGFTALPVELKSKVKLFVVGKDNPRLFQRQAKKLGVGHQVAFFSGMSDVPSLLQGADALVHPAYNENTGTVLLESLVAGLPVLCTDVCGYAHYISDADAGLVTPSPFAQKTFNQQLVDILTSPKRPQWKDNALMFAEKADIYSMPERATAIIESALQRNKR